MAKDEGQISLRAPIEVLDRADSMRERLALDPTVRALSRGGEVTRSDVLRVALVKGLDVLDHELPKAARKRRRAS